MNRSCVLIVRQKNNIKQVKSMKLNYYKIKNFEGYAQDGSGKRSNRSNRSSLIILNRSGLLTRRSWIR